MEVETSKLQRDLQLQNQNMIQQEREAQVALKTEQQAHEEDIEKAARQKVSILISYFINFKVVFTYLGIIQINYIAYYAISKNKNALYI